MAKISKALVYRKWSDENFELKPLKLQQKFRCRRLRGGPLESILVYGDHSKILMQVWRSEKGRIIPAGTAIYVESDDERFMDFLVYKPKELHPYTRPRPWPPKGD